MPALPSALTEIRRIMPGKIGIFLCLLLSMWSATVAAQAPPSAPPVRELQVGDSRLQFYGFFRTDVIVDDSRPDAFQTPLFVLSEPATATDLANFTLHPRLTKLGLSLAGPALEPLGGARLGGRLEFDFQNAGRESRAIPRYRQAYFTLAWSTITLLFGQTADVISPLFPSANADTLMWNAGNLGDRRPQIRLTVQRGINKLQWSIAAGAGLTGAVDAQDLDNDTIRDGEAAAVPNVQGRVALSYPSGTRPVAVGIWAHAARQQVSVPIAGQREFASHALGVDYEVPLGRRSILRGEVWTGRNLSDVRGGIGQGVNRLTGREISSRGGWTELGIDVTVHHSLVAGFTVDTPHEEDLAIGGRRRNGSWFVVNRWTIRPVTLGVDYLRWTTKYLGAPEGTDNRVNAYFLYSF